MKGTSDSDLWSVKKLSQPQVFGVILIVFLWPSSARREAQDEKNVGDSDTRIWFEAAAAKSGWPGASSSSL